MKEYQYRVADHEVEIPLWRKIRLGSVGALVGLTLAVCMVLLIVAWPGMQVSSAAPLPAPTSEPESGGDAGSPLVIEDPSLDEEDDWEREIAVSPSGREVYIIVHQQHLNREVAVFLQEEPDLPFRDVVISLLPGEMTVTAQVEVIGLFVGLEVQARVTALDCKPQVEITALAVGGIWTPQFVKDQAAGYIYDSLEKYPDDYPICWTGIGVNEGEITVKGLKK